MTIKSSRVRAAVEAVVFAAAVAELAEAARQVTEAILHALGY